MTITLGGPVAASGGPVRGNTVMWMGNSIAANGHHLTGTTEPGYMNDNSMLCNAILASEWKLCAKSANHLTGGLADDAAAATSNFSARQVIDAHLATVVANEPAIAIFGPIVTNGGPDYLTVGSGEAAVREFVTAIQAYGGLPVLVSEPPSGVDAINTSRTWVAQWNAWLRRYAQEEGVVYGDIYGALVDPSLDGKFLTGMSTDGLHLTRLGAKAAGEAVMAALAPILDQIPSVQRAQSSESQLILATNPLQYGGGAGSAPTGWTLNGTGTPNGNEAATKGRWFEIEASVSGYTATLPNLLAADGDRLMLAMRVRGTSIPGGGSAKVVFRPQATADVGGVTLTADGGGTFAAEWTHTNNGGTANRMLLLATGVGTKVAVSQLTLINLTAKAISPV